ncbi:MAG: hypothetical protein GYA33_03105 [Thermogutta sp.]|nr:hypothetical protein [Thermogutta sp.]
MSWAKATIALAAVTAAFTFTLRRLGEYGGIHFPELTHFFAYAPAFLLGMMYWLHCPVFSRSRAVLAFATVPIVGLTYASFAGGNTPLVVAAFLVMGIPIAAMITVHRWWIPAARIFVLANAAAVLLTLHLDYVVHSGSWGRILARFGYTLLESGEASSNPNQVGGQFALAAVMGMIVFLRSSRPVPRSAASGRELWGEIGPGDWAGCVGAAGGGAWIPTSNINIASVTPQSAWGGLSDIAACPSPGGTAVRAAALDWVSLLAAGLSALGCILTGSRGAGLTLLASLGLLMLADARFQSKGRQRDLVAVGLAALWLGALAVFLAGINPLERIQTRLLDSDSANIRSLGSRLPIWENAILAWTADAGRIVIGTGTGQADRAVGQLDEDATLSEHGDYVRNCHNMFLEWLLSFGLLGLVPGGWFYLTCWRQAALLDRAEGTFSRRTLLLTATLFGMTAVFYRHFHWVFTSAWLLALLDPASLGAGMAPSARCKEPAESPRDALSPGRGGAWRDFPGGRFRDGLAAVDKKPVASSMSIPSFPSPRVCRR